MYIRQLKIENNQMDLWNIKLLWELKHQVITLFNILNLLKLTRKIMKVWIFLKFEIVIFFLQFRNKFWKKSCNLTLAIKLKFIQYFEFILLKADFLRESQNKNLNSLTLLKSLKTIFINLRFEYPNAAWGMCIGF